VKSTAIRTVDFRSRQLSKAGYRKELPRATMDIETALKDIAPILTKVKDANESDLLDLCEKFDGIRQRRLEFQKQRLQRRLQRLIQK